MNLDGSNVKQLTDKEDYPLAITPDSKSILFSSWRTTKMSLWRTSIDGGEPVQISNLFINTGSISPDGKLIACHYRDENPNSPEKLILLPIEGGAPVKTLDLLPTTGGAPEWSPDGKSLIVADNRTGTSNLWSLPLDGGPMKQLTDYKPDYIFTFDRQWSGDGKLMAMSRGTVTSDVILISDFR
jgi:TolB protein